MTMTVPSMGQLISGVSVTKTSMVTTSDPAVRAPMIIHHHTWLTVPLSVILQDQPMPPGVLLPKSITTKVIINIKGPMTPTVTSVCLAVITTPIRIRVVTEANIEQGRHTTLVITLIMKTRTKTITYRKERWAWESSTDTLCPYSDFVCSILEVRARSSTSVPYLRTSIQRLVMTKWSPPLREHILPKIILMRLKLCFQNSVKHEWYLRCIYVPSPAIHHGTILSWDAIYWSWALFLIMPNRASHGMVCPFPWLNRNLRSYPLHRSHISHACLRSPKTSQPVQKKSKGPYTNRFRQTK